MTQLILVRHGQTDWNVTRRFQGKSDIPLNRFGHSQARAVARLLADRTWDAVVASPLRRACDTGAIIARALGLDEPLVLPGLVERSYGEAEGMTRDELITAYSGGVEGGLIPGCETRSQVTARASAALRDIAERFPDGMVIVVTHGGVIGSLLRSLSDNAVPPQGSSIGNGSRHEFALIDGTLRLVAFDGSGDVVANELDFNERPHNVPANTIG
ncbi:histidine phosphatase family protein [Rathayibacter toxicus]|uniref:Histidine phosphatase family protein n=1 Tax=Rathayibacter toxicus TaxID=145458 RepID=A0A0U1PTC0_9MICO|nr:histidine phosphatase family protein [Rathayibacter toxicus]KKM45352.1 hypothetical protein VT73_06905 [Rathayibacter toxicus]PPG21820.1 histidine phosphatase family protein [Rathayibacter toxicus]PPG46782.1 histidine phosphatase family protein [Rathayibacter toxicus]PPH23853.1 histidine phosphatase family protein [Rathayibacter toxicus]PPH57661.1 histidine phosphatase family protein [Rathayibacter toxicus]